MTKFPYGLSLVLPALDEEENIEPATDEAVEALSSLLDRHEVWIVDDGSHDGTAAAIDRLKKRHPSVRSISHPRNLGYGAALKNGFAAATLPYVAFTDSDRQFDPVDFERLLPKLGIADFVVGYRIDRVDPFLRRVYSRGYAAVIRAVFGLRIRDLNCAFKIMDREKLLRLELRSDHYFINVEMLVKGLKRGYRIDEVGVRHRVRASGRSKVTLAQIPRTIREVRRLHRELHQRKPEIHREP